MPDKHVIDALVRVVYSEEAANGFVLDGYPRRANQVDELEAVLGDQKLDKVILLDVPREEAMRRARERRICTNGKCGEVYGGGNQLPEGQPCVRCGGPVARRQDDTEDALQRRHEIYAAETLPAVDLYAHRGLLRRVDGTGTTEAVHRAVLAAVGY